ncbi:MAG: hypothetical protein RJA81_2145, partial [Planctomycetota bacterium]
MKRKDRYAKFFSGRVVTRSKSIRKTRLIPETLECRTVMDGSGWIPSDLLNLQHDEIVLSVTSGPSELGITDQSADTQFLVAPAPGQFEPVSTSVSTDTSQNLTDPSSDFLVMPVGPSVPSAKFSPVPSETEVIVALRGDDGLSRLTHWAGQGTNASSLVNDAGSQILFINQGLTYISLPTPSGQTEKVIALLEQQTFVEWASPNMIYSTQGGFDPREFVPNDPYYNLQWHHPLMGNTQAWDEAGTFGGGIVVAILDDGVRLNHPDLTDNIWVNPLEIPGNGIDDDGNGYTDDVQGWDFSASDNNPNPDSTTSHGTPVAGNVAARINNNTGVAGVAGNATLLPVRFYGSGAWTSSIVAQSYAYSVDNGARILNVSYNIDGFANDPLFRASLQYVYDSGAIYMNSAGNNGQLNPARGVFDQSLFVMASDPDDKLLPYSNYGTFIDLVAPADPVATTSDTGYEYFNGTSSATPVASGAMALAWGANPTWTRDQVIAAILGNTDNIDAQNPGLADYLGYGRVNTFKALTMTPAAPKLGAISGLPAEGSTITEVLSDFTIDTASIYDASTITSSQFEMRYAGGDGILDTSDDRLIPIAVQSVNGGDYSYGTNKLSLQVRGSMPPGSYRFSALSGESGILDPFGQQLDGNGDGIAGDSLTRTFQVSYQVSGFAYIDDNRDSQFQTDEFSISGITVFADANANGMVDLNAPVQVNSTNVPVSILDNTTVNSTLSVNLGNNSIASIKVGLSLNHTYDSDLTIELYSPSGKRVLLVSGAGGSGDNFSNTVFDDNATRSIYSGSAPFTGSFRPAEPLSAFAGENPDGTWRLAITDSYTYDTGTLLSWNLEIVTPQEALSTTKLNGGWSFNGLPDGSYDIIAVNPAEVYMGLMTPISGSYGVTISSPDDSFDGLDFGFIPRPVYEVHSLGMNYFNGDLLGFSANLTQDSEIKRITIRNLGVGTILFDSISISSPF